MEVKTGTVYPMTMGVKRVGLRFPFNLSPKRSGTALKGLPLGEIWVQGEAKIKSMLFASSSKSDQLFRLATKY
jgi:hypothetical protein